MVVSNYHHNNNSFFKGTRVLQKMNASSEMGSRFFFLSWEINSHHLYRSISKRMTKRHNPNGKKRTTASLLVRCFFLHTCRRYASLLIKRRMLLLVTTTGTK